MKNKITSVFEQIERKSRIDVIMSKVNALLIASVNIDSFAECEWLLNKCIEDLFYRISVNSTDETAE